MQRDKIQLHNLLSRYAFALAMVAASVLVRYALNPVFVRDHHIYIIVYPAIIIAALFAGMGPAILTSILGALAAEYYFSPALEISDLPAISIIVLTGFLTGWLAQSLRTALAQSRERSAALAESEQRLRATFDNAGVGILEADIEGRFIAANEHVCAILGYRREELVGMLAHDLTAPEDRPHRDELDAKLHRGEIDRFEDEKRYLRRDGTRIWVHITVTAVRDEQGKWLRAIGTVEDISKRKMAEDELTENRDSLIKLANELKSKNEELESIVNIASHDLRSPIVNIMGFSGELARSTDYIRHKLLAGNIAEVTRNEIIPVLESDIPEDIKFLEASTHSIDQMLRSLLRVTHMVMTDIHPGQIDMNALIKKTCEYFENAVKTGNIELTIDQLPSCYADQALLREIFYNLIDNAFKYLDPQRPGRIAIHGSTRNQYSVYCVEDNGRGIAAEHQKQIFKLFHRLEIDTSSQGIGLTIVRRLVNRMDGNVWLESQPGIGSKFFVAMPRA